MVLCVVEFVERYVFDVKWYVEVMMEFFEMAGDVVKLFIG